MLLSRSIATKIVVITVASIDNLLIKLGFTIVDRAVAKKGVSTREVTICE